MDKKRIGVAILGGTGYGAGELLRLLANHAQAEVVSVTSSSIPGELLSAAHPHLEGFFELRFVEQPDIETLLSFEHALVFSSLPHGASAQAIEDVAKAGQGRLKIIDLSGDFRLSNPAAHAEFYADSSANAQLRAAFRYGLPELYFKEIAKAQCVANPGCFATACILAVAPLVFGRGFSGTIHFDAKTGTSGGGKTPQPLFHHPAQHANLLAYKILEHRHEPEIREGLGDFTGERLQTTFVPHLLPVSRGIFATAYLTCANEMNSKELRELYGDFYAQAPFVRVRDRSPEFNSVIGSNFCDVTVTARGPQVIAMSTIDNLGKGMAGQAIQNMNIICGLDQRLGLWQPALGLI